MPKAERIAEEVEWLLEEDVVRLPVIDRNFSDISPEYEQFATDKDACRACGVYDHYEQVVQSEGNALDPTFMFIGEAPGGEEAQQVRPFIGPAGQLLRDELKKHRDVFNKSTTLISNVIACRPLNNKFPTGPDSRKCFNLWLDREIKLAKPKVVICLGNHALKYVRGEMGITKARGTWSFLDHYGAASFATFHPSYVIRCQRAKNQEAVDQFEQDIATVAHEYANQLQVTSG